jgi:hypothetical protein
MLNTPAPKSRLQWFYVTRSLGVAILLFGVFGDASADRGTIILTGAGLLGIDKVARAEPKG